MRCKFSSSGVGLRTNIEFHLLNNNTKEELYKYFEPGKTSTNNRVSSEDINNLDISRELSSLLSGYDMLRKTSITDPNNELVDSIRNRETNKNMSLKLVNKSNFNNNYMIKTRVF